MDIFGDYRPFMIVGLFALSYAILKLSNRWERAQESLPSIWEDGAKISITKPSRRYGSWVYHSSISHYQPVTPTKFTHCGPDCGPTGNHYYFVSPYIIGINGDTDKKGIWWSWKNMTVTIPPG